MTKLFEEIELKNILRTASEGSQIRVRAAGKDKDGEEIFFID
ncbi:MAG: hypothetical protein XD75_0588 [Parcubacteria bacterium 33_209]|nr:MAG: hypothetical protein XD75_0588 [Parcubacteria bacterium 33_209]